MNTETFDLNSFSLLTEARGGIFKMAIKYHCHRCLNEHEVKKDFTDNLSDIENIPNLFSEGLVDLNLFSEGLVDLIKNKHWKIANNLEKKMIFICEKCNNL